ncbi:cob(I)yrinic acid a,c-diamide adenosyltransferase [Thermodesulfobacteriota bacterium]
MGKSKSKGLIIVHTGNGKGKTTAAMGMALRAAGHNHKILMVQFIKGSWSYGELEAVKRLSPNFEILPLGKGFIRFDKEGPDPEDRKAVIEAWDIFKKRMRSGEFDMIILDEINYALSYNLLDLEDVLVELKTKPEGTHLVLTGRDAHPKIIEIADLATEMKEIKHPFHKGIKAQKGIEF